MCEVMRDSRITRNPEVNPANAWKVLGLYLKRPRAKLRFRAVLEGRFRYNDLKEALTAACAMGFGWS